MNLVLDIGNTRTKAAFFEGNEIVEHFYLDKNPLSQLKKILADRPDIRFSIVSSVLTHSKESINFLQHKTNCIELNEHTKLPIEIKYRSPETLGKDRLAAAVGAWSLFRNENSLSVDAGTCIKFDLVTKDGAYHGGSISPGIGMRFKALNTFTDKLPLISMQEDFTSLTGTNSRESILSGVQNGALLEVEGFINKYCEQYPGLKLVITGGDANFFENALKKSIFVSPDLVLIGLNEILNLNVS
jgi:type III pantothenate kinase